MSTAFKFSQAKELQLTKPKTETKMRLKLKHGSIIEKVKALMQKKGSGLVFLDREGDLVVLPVTLKTLHDAEALERAKSTVPTFEVCVIERGQVMTNDFTPTDLDKMPDLIEDAKSAWKYFYSERVKQYGREALPVGIRDTFGCDEVAQ